MIAHAIEGAVAGTMYKTEVAAKTEPARTRYTWSLNTSTAGSERF
jgi:hypothetical protein